MAAAPPRTDSAVRLVAAFVAGCGLVLLIAVICDRKLAPRPLTVSKPVLQATGQPTTARPPIHNTFRTIRSPQTIIRPPLTTNTTPKPVVARDTPPNVRVIYRKDGSVAGWIAPGGTPPPTIPIDAPRYTPTYHNPPSYVPVAENGSSYGEISNYTGRPRTIHVNSYFRRDGTYVRGHYRSR